MSDREALKVFSRQPVNSEMINYLVATTNSIIQVKSSPKSKISSLSTADILVSPILKKNTSLRDFIKNLIRYSNVQTPTLMATLIYLNKLRNLLPANAIGMETTRHRIFLSALILSAKSLNDSSPLNKHWTKYTDGLLTLSEVNMAERELIGLLNWNVNVNEEDLIIALQPFLIPIKQQLARKLSIEQHQKMNYYRLSNVHSVVNNSPQAIGNSPSYGGLAAKGYYSPASRSSSASSISSYSPSVNSPALAGYSGSSQSINSLATNYLNSSSSGNLHNFINEEHQNMKNYTYRAPLQAKSINALNRSHSQNNSSTTTTHGNHHYHHHTHGQPKAYDNSYYDMNLMQSGKVIA